MVRCHNEVPGRLIASFYLAGGVGYQSTCPAASATIVGVPACGAAVAVLAAADASSVRFLGRSMLRVDGPYVMTPTASEGQLWLPK